MGCIQADYLDVRALMKPGDVVAFGGRGASSELIKFVTRSVVSHNATVLQSRLLIDGEPQAGMLNQIVESLIPSGVSMSRLSDRLAQHSGEVWWLPLSDAVRARLRPDVFFDWLLHQNRKPYDYHQAVEAGLDLFGGRVFRAGEDWGRIFCSELSAGALEASGAIGRLNASEVTPADLCAFAIYAPDYYQIKGQPREIKGYNRVDPTGWGQ